MVCVLLIAIVETVVYDQAVSKTKYANIVAVEVESSLNEDNEDEFEAHFTEQVGPNIIAHLLLQRKRSQPRVKF